MTYDELMWWTHDLMDPFIWWTHDVMNTCDLHMYVMNICMWWANVWTYDEHMHEHIWDEQIYCICYEHMQCNVMKTCL